MRRPQPPQYCTSQSRYGQPKPFLVCGAPNTPTHPQVDGNGGGKFRLDWVWLGWSTQEALMAATATLQFSDLFDAATPGAPSANANGTASTGPCPDGYRPINAGGRGCECLRVKAGMETYAAFLETRRYRTVEKRSCGHVRMACGEPGQDASLRLGATEPCAPACARVRRVPATAAGDVTLISSPHTPVNLSCPGTPRSWAPPPSSPSGRASPSTPSAGSCTPP